MRLLTALALSACFAVVALATPAASSTAKAAGPSSVRTSIPPLVTSAAKKKCVTKKVHGKKKKVCATAPKLDGSQLHAAWAYFGDTSTLDVHVMDTGNPNPSGAIRANKSGPRALILPNEFRDIVIQGENFQGATLDGPTGSIKFVNGGLELDGPFTNPFEAGFHVHIARPTANLALTFYASATEKVKGIPFITNTTSEPVFDAVSLLRGWYSPSPDPVEVLSAFPTDPQTSGTFVPPATYSFFSNPIGQSNLSILGGNNCPAPVLTKVASGVLIVKNCAPSPGISAVENQSFGLKGASAVAPGSFIGVGAGDASGKLQGLAIAEQSPMFTDLVGQLFYVKLNYVGQANGNQDCDLSGLNFYEAAKVEITKYPLASGIPYDVNVTLPDGTKLSGGLGSDGSFQGGGTDKGGHHITIKGTLNIDGSGSFSQDVETGLDCHFLYRVSFDHLVSSRLDPTRQALLERAPTGGSTTDQATVINNSPKSLTINGASIQSDSGSGWYLGSPVMDARILRRSQSGGPCAKGQVLQSGDSCTIAIRFAPPAGSSGVLTGALHVQSDAADDPDLAIVLAGIAQQPAVCSSFSGLSASFTAYDGSLPLSFTVSGKTSGNTANSTWSLSVSGYGQSPPFAESANFSAANPYKFVIFTYKDQYGNVVGELDGFLQYNASAGTMTLSATPSGNLGNLAINPSTVNVTTTPGVCS